MAQHEQTNCLERMCAAIGAGEDWLVDRAQVLAREQGIRRTPHTDLARREAIRGLSDAIFQAVYGNVDGYAEGPAHGDPVVAYGVVRARLQVGRGVRASDWVRLVHHYRHAYLELLSNAELGDEEDVEICRRFIHRVFDRFENGFCTECVLLSEREAQAG